MSEPVLARAVLASLLTHAAVVVAVSPLLGLASPMPPAPALLIELVTVAPAPPAPAPTPPKEVPKPKKAEPLTPPRIVAREPEPPAETPSPVEPPAPPLVDQPLSAPPLATPLEPSPRLALPTLKAEDLAGNRGRGSGAGAAGSEAGAGKLASAGDFAIAAGPGVGGGSGVAARTGDGPGGPLALARPMGGYQTRPVYPESARRRGIGGVTLLQFEVTANGRVGEIRIAQSAGDRDLDQAAIEAVKKWRFEPARRGAQAVAVWVEVPVKFELKGK